MNETVVRSWWMLAVRGAIAFVFGVLALLWPGLTLLLLVALFGAYALVGGAVWTAGAIHNRKFDRRWWQLLPFGLVSIAAGLMAVLWPGVAALVLLLLVGAHALMTGVFDLFVALRLRRHVQGEALLLLCGLASIGFGLVVLMFPQGAGALALVWLVGSYAMLTGALMMALALRVRGWARRNAARSSPAAGLSQ
ncbi:MAG: DUF308 domain-containing protein [Pseudomonadota bacterium]